MRCRGNPRPSGRGGCQFGITSKGLDERFHLADPATADTVINHNVIEDISSAETILSEAVKIDGDGSGLSSG